MKRNPIVSSNIVGVGHDKDKSTLEIEFKNGSVYQYTPVSFKIYREFMDSPSLGQYLAKHIKGNSKYKHKKI